MSKTINRRPFFFALIVFALDLFYWYSDTNDDEYYKYNDFVKILNFIIENTVAKIEWLFLGLGNNRHPITVLTHRLTESLGSGYLSTLIFTVFLILWPVAIFLLWYGIGMLFFGIWDRFMGRIIENTRRRL